jgi:hypothetical protein
LLLLLLSLLLLLQFSSLAACHMRTQLPAALLLCGMCATVGEAIAVRADAL